MFYRLFKVGNSTYRCRPVIFFWVPSCVPSIFFLFPLDVYETCPLSPALSSYSKHLAFYDVVLTGHSFLYNQVRRMVGAAVAAAFGRLKLQEQLTFQTSSSFFQYFIN